MRIGKIGHASVVIEAGDVFCAMDPVFSDPFESDSNGFDPPIRIDAREVHERANLLVVSHSHWDHFCPRTLAGFDRDVPVLYPAGDRLIPRALDRLGFTRATAVSPGEQIEVEGVSLIPTPSRVPIAEVGMLFVHAGRVFWNMVDTGVDESAIGWVLAVVGRVDLLFAKFQPLIEEELRTNALGSDFPYARYGRLLRNVWTLRPRAVAPASCGYRYVRGDWLNDRGFPITEAQFLHDIRQVTPSVQGIHVPHGGTVTVSDAITVDADGLPFVERLAPRSVPAFDWRPERGVPPLRDGNPRGHAPADLRAQVRRFLDDDLLTALRASDPAWLARMARLCVRWRLEVIDPDGPCELRALDFAATPLAWSTSTADTFVKLHTSVTASAVVGLLRGECNAYSLNFHDLRIAHRMYAVHPDGVTEAGSADDEPLTRVLFAGADERYLERVLSETLPREHTDAGGARRATRPVEVTK